MSRSEDDEAGLPLAEVSAQGIGFDSSGYLKQARDFLEKFDLGMKIVVSNTKRYPWKGAPGADVDKHTHYRIKIYRNAAPRRGLWFDFWGSVRDWEKNIQVNEYDVLAAISGDETYLSSKDIYEEFGSGAFDMDIKKIVAWAKRMNVFFTKDELAALREIS